MIGDVVSYARGTAVAIVHHYDAKGEPWVIAWKSSLANPMVWNQLKDPVKLHSYHGSTIPPAENADQFWADYCAWRLTHG